MIDAFKSEAWGLVNSVKPYEELMPYCISLANKIKQNGPLAIASAIKAVNSNYKDNINGFDVEISEFAKCFGTEDFQRRCLSISWKKKGKF